jgi:DNA-binding MarR family transcriptional regulator
VRVIGGKVQLNGTRREMLPELADLSGHLIWRAQAQVTAATDSVLPENVDVHAYAVLVALGDGVPRSQQALARTVDVSRTTVMRVASDLADRGLVERVRNPSDRRSYLLTRTPEGARTARAWRRHVQALEDAVTSGLTPRQHDDLQALLTRVVEPELAPDTPDALRASVGFLVTRLYSRMRSQLAQVLRPVGIDPPHVGILTALVASGPVTQSELARMFAVSGAHMVQLLDELEERDLVARRRLESDRRAQVIDLLPGAAERLAQARPLADAVVADRLHELTPVQVERLLALLRRVIATG